MEILRFEKFELSEDDVRGGILGSSMATGSRHPGVHQSSIIRYINPPASRNTTTELTSWYREVGFAWEMALETVFKVRMQHHHRDRVHQVTFEVDGIHQSPDGLVFDGPPPGLVPSAPGPVEDFLEEYKCTWRSKRNVGVAPNYTEFYDNFWSWHIQTMGYCRSAKVTRCDFYVLFINGDYVPMIPDACYISVRYSPQEIEENWEMVLKNRDEMIERGLLDA